MSEPPHGETPPILARLRSIRDEISREISGLGHEELMTWLRDRPYADPLLKRLALRARERAPQYRAGTDGDN